MKNIVSVGWLKTNIKNKNIIILDASIPSKAKSSPPKSNHQTIKGARFFDLANTFSDKEATYPNTVPSSAVFEKEARKLGINKDSKIIVFDHLGIYSSPRIWWLFKLMGHDQVAVLNGGLPEWIKHGLATEEKQSKTPNEKGGFTASYQSTYYRSFDALVQNIATKKELVIDARSYNRFYGLSPEPRKGLRGGHIPNSINIPFESVLSEGKFKTKEELNLIFNQFDLKDQPLIFSCGSGITACIIYLACEEVLYNPKAVFDGSWTEWAQRTDQ
jgi:thiosulfate/3-mercaptopyruvate sulfurtransferase